MPWSHRKATAPDPKDLSHTDDTDGPPSGRCDVCKIQFPADGEYEYLVHSYWGQHSCVSHAHDGTTQCRTCERLVPRGVQYFVQNGGNLCAECGGSRLRSTDKFQLLCVIVKQFFESQGIKFEQEIPVYWVPQTDDMGGLVDGSEGIDGDQMTNPEKVTAPKIWVSCGLPRLLAGSVIAQKMMQAWLTLNVTGYVLGKDDEQGICQVLGVKWLEYMLSRIQSREATMGDSTPELQAEEKLGDFFKHQMFHPTCQTNEGFRRGWDAVLKFGLDATLNHLKETGTFPC